MRNRAWFFDGLEAEYDNIYIEELPPNADTNHLWRGSNLAEAQVNLTPANILYRRTALQRLPFALRRHLLAHAAAEHYQEQTPLPGCRTYATNIALPTERCCRLVSE